MTQPTHTIERIARVLAGERLSSNAEGAEPSAGDIINARWPEFTLEAEAVLKSLRDPPPEISALGEGAAWSRAIAAALGEPEGEEQQPKGKLEELKGSVEHFLKAPS
ncbi:MAG: hypothetical protein ACTHLU_01275 [Novosphingobium sp.]